MTPRPKTTPTGRFLKEGLRNRPIDGRVGAYVWENWEAKAHGRTTEIKYGFSLKKPDPGLVEAIRTIYDGPFEQTVFDKYTFPITAY